MIKAVGTDGQGKTMVFLGLSKENTRRLLKGYHMVVDLQELDSRLPDVAVVLLGGQTEQELSSRLGHTLPQPAPGERHEWRPEDAGA